MTRQTIDTSYCPDAARWAEMRRLGDRAKAQDAIETASPRSEAIEQPLAGLLAVLFAGLLGSVAVLAWGLWS
jgi:hypothetical protein